MRKFRVRDVGENLILHSHLPPLNSPRLRGRFVREQLVEQARRALARPGRPDQRLPAEVRLLLQPRPGRPGPLDTAEIHPSRRPRPEAPGRPLARAGRGGEPLLNKDIVGITGRGRGRARAVKLFTTGSALTPALARRPEERRPVLGLASAWTIGRRRSTTRTGAIRGPSATALRSHRHLPGRGRPPCRASPAVLSRDMIRRGQTEEFLAFLRGPGHPRGLAERGQALRAGLLERRAWSSPRSDRRPLVRAPGPLQQARRHDASTTSATSRAGSTSAATPGTRWSTSTPSARSARASSRP
ncbi:MAG: hypothetical protein MZU84_06030 [Sphingobacterium sp.]|nr:hypothetical protein [Sphingobacterium sp.]